MRALLLRRLLRDPSLATMLRRLAPTQPACCRAVGGSRQTLLLARVQQHGCFSSQALAARRLVVQPAARFTAAAASESLAVEDAEPSAAAAETPELGPEEAELTRQWGAFIATLKANGTFSEFGEDGERLSEAGAVKRAALECGRRRTEALYDLPQAELKAFVAAYSGEAAQGTLKDRKCFNAGKRLTASYVAGAPLAVGEGGAATFQDVCRMLWGVSTAVAAREPGVPQDMLTHGAQLLEQIVGIISRQPSEAALEQAAAAEEQRREQELAAAEAREAKRSQRLEARSFGVGDLGSRAPRDGFGSYGSGRGDTRPGDWECTDCGANNFARRGDCFKCGAPKPEGGYQAYGGRQQRDFGRRSDYGGRQQQQQQQREIRAGDWPCAECDAHNFASKEACFKCGADKPEGAGYPDSAISQPRDGFAGRSSFGGRGEYGGRGDFGGRQQQQREVRPGDWGCTECSAHNFATKTACYKCGADKATSSMPLEATPRSGGFRSSPPSIVRGGDGRARNSRANWMAGDWECPSCAAHNFASKAACFRCGVPKPEGLETAAPSGSRGGGRGSGRGGRDRSDTSFGATSYSGPEPAADLEW